MDASKGSVRSASTFGGTTPQQPIQAMQATLAPQPAVINGIAPSNLAPGLGPGNIYEPRIYGFRVSELAKSGPRMKWLRSRPLNVNELDEVAVAIWASNQAAGQQRDAHMEEGDADEDIDNQDEEEGVMDAGLDGAGDASRTKGRRKEATNGDRDSGGAAVG